MLKNFFEPPAPMEADTILSMKELGEAIVNYLKEHNRIPENVDHYTVQYWQEGGDMTARIAFAISTKKQADGK
jgi:hypothetical protein